jgi:uncharacterized protein YukE
MGLFSSLNPLIRVARAILQTVLSKLTQQVNEVAEQALSPMQAMIRQVVGGVWTGEGADRFVEEVSSMMIPGVGQVMDHINLMNTNLQRASDIIEEADRRVQGMVNSLGDIFDAVFPA